MTLVDRDLVTVIRRLPGEVVAVLKSPGGCAVAGGFVRDCITGDQPHDIDLFTRNKDHARILAERLRDETKARLVETPNAYTVCSQPLPIQLIHRWVFENSQQIIESFDFTIAQAVVWWDNGWLSLCSENFYPDLAAKRLVYTRPTRDEAPGGSLLRVLKLYQRGYGIPLSSMAAVVSQLIGKIDDNKKERFTADSEWREQLLARLLYDVDPSANPKHYIEETFSAEEITQPVVA